MKERIKQSGTSLRLEQIKDAQDILVYDFVNDVSYNPNIVTYKTDNKIPIKIYDQKYSASYGFIAKFLSPYNVPIELGQLLYDTAKNEYWLCIEAYNVSNIHYKGQLGKCARFLKWQDEIGLIKQTPIIVTTASKYNNGENKISTLTLGSDQLMLFAQLNDDTVKLDRGIKFFIDENKMKPSVYEITRTDTALYTYMGKGFLSIIATEQTYTPSKRELELGVCDYKEIYSSVSSSLLLNPNEMTDLSATISGNKELKIGFPRTYTVNFTDKNGNKIDWKNIDFKWKILSDFNINQNIFQNKIELLVNDEDRINYSFSLQVLVDNIFLSEIKINVTDVA